MKMRTFYDEPAVAQAKFNEWAAGKTLDRTVIIHTHALSVGTGLLDGRLLIVVITPEGAVWDSTKSTPLQRIQSEANKRTGLEHKDERILLAPIHEEPEPHIKLEEAQVTQ